jgi:hypothetical protein
VNLLLLAVAEMCDECRQKLKNREPKKIQKKACQSLACSARGELRATNALLLSFKKSLKK